VPLLADVMAELERLDDAGRRVAARLHPYVAGSMKGLFDGPTTTAATGHLIVYALKDLPEQLHAVGTLLTLDTIWRTVRGATASGQRPDVLRMVLVDEAWKLLSGGRGSVFLETLAKSARKYGVALTVVTQDAADVLATKTGRAVVSICGLPAAVFFVLLGLGGDGGFSPPLVIGAPALIAYPVAVWLWLRARRPESTGRACLLATLGLLLVVVTSFVPVAILGSALAEQWQETQPGGRGYRAPTAPGERTLCPTSGRVPAVPVNRGGVSAGATAPGDDSEPESQIGRRHGGVPSCCSRSARRTVVSMPSDWSSTDAVESVSARAAVSRWVVPV
jgi:hypothetical protein